MSDKQFIIVSGCGRSGTTLLNRLLASHPLIVLGMERYIRLFTRQYNQFTPALFTRERFFDCRLRDSGLFDHRRPMYEKQMAHMNRMEEKWDDALFVGDKIPTLFRRFEETLERFPGAIFVHIIRGINDVCASWLVRGKSFDATSGFTLQNAVSVWNQSNTRALRFKEKFPDNMVIVDYERMYVPQYFFAAGYGEGCDIAARL